MTTAGQVLISAHRGGCAHDPALENTRAGLDLAAASDVEYVEVDVRRLRDGTLVLCHDPEVVVDGRKQAVSGLTHEQFATAFPQTLLYDEALEVLAGRAGVHLDLKLRSPAAAYATPEECVEVVAVARAVERLGADRVVATSGNLRAIRAMLAWADSRSLDLRVGLSVGGSVKGGPWRRLRGHARQLAPGPRLTASGANLLVANQWLALLRLARFARRADVPLLVWTVDHPVALRYWLRPGRAWLVTTNRPEQALALRSAMGSHSATILP